MAINSTDVYSSVDKHYGSAARAQETSKNGYSQKVAEAFGYSASDLEGMPEEANLGLSCGNPIALAKLGEVRIATLSPHIVPFHTDIHHRERQ